MFIAIIIVLVVVICFIVFTQKGLNFEEDCAARIQEHTHELSGQHIAIGEARLRLRTIIDLINKVNEVASTPKFISLRNAREMAVAIHMRHLSSGTDLKELAIDQIKKN